MRVLTNLPLVAFISIGASLAQAEPTAFQVNGADGKPVAGAVVLICAKGMRGMVADGTTDASGALALDVAHKPEYDYAVYAPGFRLYERREARLSDKIDVKMVPCKPSDRLAVIDKAGVSLFGGTEPDVTLSTGYTGGWQFDIAAGPGVLIGKSDPDQALLRHINVGQSFVAKKGKDRVTCKLLCGIPKRGPLIEY
jgi:hypothetical protein